MLTTTNMSEYYIVVKLYDMLTTTNMSEYYMGFVYIWVCQLHEPRE